MKKVIAFIPDYNDEHATILTALAAGIPGAITRPVTQYEPCDIAIIFGGVKKSFAKTWSKEAVLERHSGRSLIMVEAGLVRRKLFYQVGWGGFAGHGDFNTEGKPLDLKRWKALGLVAEPWKFRNRNPIVVCGQLPWDVQVQDFDHIGWVQSTVRQLQGMTETPVLFRPHPLNNRPEEYGISRDIWDVRPLVQTLADASAFVTFNSTSAVDAVLAGVPTVAMDRGSFAWSVTAHDLADALVLKPFDRTRWLAELAHAQWAADEMRSGMTWKWLNEP